MGTHPVPSVLPKAARRVGARQPPLSTPPQLAHGRPHGCGPVAAAVTLQLDAATTSRYQSRDYGEELQPAPHLPHGRSPGGSGGAFA